MGLETLLIAAVVGSTVAVALSSQPKAVKPPAPPPIAPTPTVSPAAADYGASLARRRKGYESTLLTGALEPMSSGKRTTLG